MDKRIVLASAGAGKTYYIANDFKDDERVNLISFTNSNVDNIRKEIRERFNGEIPENIQIMTYDSFVYNYLLKPIEPVFLSDITTRVTILDVPEENTRKSSYKKLDTLEHFINSNNEYYVNRMGKFFLKFPPNIKKIVLSGLERYCDAIYFDEFQDYNGPDFNLLKYFLEKTNLRVIAVGDIYQSRLAPIRSIGSNGANNPFYKIDDVNDLKSKVSDKVQFDEITLEKSRRVPKVVCQMIQDKLNIDIKSHSEIDASIIHLTDIEDINNIVTDPSIPKLIWNKVSIHSNGNNYVNWTYSKGDTYPVACVILTEKTSNLDEWSKIDSMKTRNALYVALTRSKGNLYLVKQSDYKKWKIHVDGK